MRIRAGHRDPRLPVYGLHGIALASDFPFVNSLPRVDTEPDFTFSLATKPEPAGSLHSAVPLFDDPEADDFNTANLVTRAGECDLMRFIGTADFYIRPRRITCHLQAPGHADQKRIVETLLLGTVLAWWLERAGRIVLHASAVVAGKRAAAFLSVQGGGKSSLAAALTSLGPPLLTDDLLAIDCRGGRVFAHPGYPQMRMWPEEAEHFTGSYEHLPMVIPGSEKRRVAVGPGGIGSFCSEARAPGCIYLPERRPPEDRRTDVEFLPVPPRDALIHLVFGSFAPRHADVLARSGKRLEALAAIAETVPMRRVVYPSGLHLLPRVAEALLEDFARCTMSTPTAGW